MKPRTISLRLSDTVPGKVMFHVVRVPIKPVTGFFLHTHRDFAEVFWVESGIGVHLINGARKPLQRGSLVMIRPRDAHGFEAVGDEPFTLVNLSFPKAVLKEWGKRYFLKKAVFFWSDAPFPYTQEVDQEQIRRLQEWAEYLSSCPNLPFHLDWFLMDLFHTLLSDHSVGRSSEPMLPQLSKALVQIRDPQYFCGGARRLASMAGYSLQHLNRILKKQMGQSAGEIVTQARLRYAARQLQLTDHKILEIALDCGCNNLGHFYHQFKKMFGVTPRQFRLRQELVVGQGRAVAGG